MPKWKVWPAPAAKTPYELHLFVHELAGVRTAGDLMVQVEWRGNRQKAEALLRGARKNCTAKRAAGPGGIFGWDEGFKHLCKLRTTSFQTFRGWTVILEIHGFGFKAGSSGTVIIGRAQIDVSPYARLQGKTVRIPINCSIDGYSQRGELTVTLELFEVQKKEQAQRNPSVSPPLRAMSLRAFSRREYPRAPELELQNSLEGVESDDTSGSIFSSNPATDGHMSSSSDEFPVRNHRNPSATTNSRGALRRQSSQPHFHKPKDLMRILSLNRWGSSFREARHSQPNHMIPGRLQHEAGKNSSGEENGDRRVQRTNSLRVLLQQEKIPPVHSDFRYAEVTFEVGRWEKKNIRSRDGLMELETDVFLASIDQCSEQAAGEGACAVLVSVIADWLHKNRRTLPLQYEFDEMIHLGSLEWRELCKNGSNKDRFSDRHFDLETVLEAKVRPIRLVTEKSYVGFFTLDNMPERFEYLNETMTFDKIWEELLCTDPCEERIYITSWNDHFFILKVESEVIYLIDTLGERLYEGCNQAYILKFSKESVIYNLPPKPINQNEEGSSETAEGNAENKAETTSAVDESPRTILCEGMGSCKEFVKGFLAAIPLSELQHDIERGLIAQSPLHRRLQIEFHYTTPL